jgi:serine/threonine protein kinase
MADIALGLVFDALKAAKGVYDKTKEFAPMTKAVGDKHERFAKRLESVSSCSSKQSVDVSVDDTTLVELCELHKAKLDAFNAFAAELKGLGKLDRVVLVRKITKDIAMHHEAIEDLSLKLSDILERENARNIQQANQNTADTQRELVEFRAEAKERDRYDKLWQEKMGQMLAAVYQAQEEIARSLEKPGVVNEEARATTFMRSFTMLRFEITERKDDNAPEHLRVMQAIYARFELAEFQAPEYAPWFVSLNDVTFDPDDEPFPDKEFIHIRHGSFDGMRVAIKQMRIKDDFQATDQFKRELKMWSKANHENVARLYGACDAESPAFFVYECASQGDFVQFFEANGKAQLWRLFYQASLGLKHLHRKKIIHGDLKCSNLLVGKDGLAKVSGFGFSYQRALSAGLSRQAQADSIRWKAPECLHHTDDADLTNPRWASDVYALGMAIWEAANGSPPYDVDDDERIVEKKLEGDVIERPDGLEDDEWAFVESLLQSDWQARPSIDAVVTQLRSFDKRAAWRNSRAMRRSPP